MTAIVWGKLPAHGDFIARGLSAAARDALDDWLAASLAAAQAVLGAGFEHQYDAAQPWRFAEAEADGRWLVGALAPSVDAVGRRYPVLVARGQVPDSGVEAVAEAAEALLYAALSEGWDADRLQGAAAEIVPGGGSRWTYGSGWWTVGETGLVEAGVAGVRPPELMRAMLMMQEGYAWRVA